jgi:pimeloyl-ACP methyl ester carboxylesterase
LLQLSATIKARAFIKLQQLNYLFMFSAHLKFFLLFFLLNDYAFCQNQVDTTQVITIGGIRQYILIKGKDDSKPILLFLHGGPGGSLLNKTDKMTGELQKHFLVVQWDQRQTGETLKLNGSPVPLTLSLFYNDTHDLIDTLLKKFKKPKLYLAGYSWGSGLGFYIADKYPDLLYAYLAISPMIDQRRSDSISLSVLKQTMGKTARNELSAVKIPFENWEQLYYHRKWLLKLGGQKFVSLSLPKSFVHKWAITWFDVFVQSCNINLFKSLQTINCPVYFFAGEEDYQTNYSITIEYFNAVSALKKDLFRFANAGHGLPETHPGLFQDIVIDKILPATFFLSIEN